jgi:hypothetical protein
MLLGRSQSRGNTVIEFTLVGIPLVFALVSVFEMSRGMWMYHTLASALKDGVRFAIVHGNNCNLTPSNCAVRIGDIAQRINDYAIGIPPEEMLNVTFTSRTRTVTCPTLRNCLPEGDMGNIYWPAAAPGATADDGGESMMGWVRISAQYSFRSALGMFWPGAGRGQSFDTFVFPASSQETIQY